MAEVNYLEKVIAHGTARLTVGEMAFDIDLFAQLKRAVDVFR
jgi:hypothetical protein